MTSVVKQALSMRIIKAGFIPLFALLVLIACDSKPTKRLFEGQIMGTSYHVTVVDTFSDITPAAVDEGILQQLVAVDSAMSTYKPQSELMRFNRTTPGDLFPASQAFIDVMAISQQVYQDSDGAFDPTVGALVKLWGFGPDRPAEDQLPSDAAISSALATLGFGDIRIQGDSLSSKRDVFVDLSAVAKGYAVDQVAEWLLQQGLQNFLVEVGGELRTHGVSPRGDAWITAISEPSASLATKVHRTVKVSDMAVATSGDYYNYFEIDGVRYSHTIDPRTGRPVTHNLASVTVLAASCAEADAYATAIDVMGPERGLAMAERLGLPIYLLVRENDRFVAKYSSHFAAYR